MSTPIFEMPMDQGADWAATLNWYEGPTFRAPIEEVSRGYPTLIRVTGHGLPSVSDTPVIISGVQGAEILNSRDTGVELVRRVDDDHFEIPISTRACEWVEGTGEITWYTPTDITGYTGRAQLRTRWFKGEVLAEMTTENGGMTLTVEDASCQLNLTAAQTAELAFTKGYIQPELIAPGGAVVRLAQIVVTMEREVTR